MKVLPVIELYSAIQGEGKYTGIPHIIIRTTGCPMRCCFGKSVCDSPFTSYMAKKGSITEEQIYEFYATNYHIQHTMITGGEPTMHAEVLNLLVNIAKKFNHFVTIETAGIHYVQTKADFISISPKLKTSVPKVGFKYSLENKEVEINQNAVDRHENLRLNLSEMKDMITNHLDYQIKPVISDIERDVKEVEELILFLNTPRNKVYLMPAGSTSSELKLIRRDLIEFCIREGYNYTDRIHIVAFENERYR